MRAKFLGCAGLMILLALQLSGRTTAQGQGPSQDVRALYDRAEHRSHALVYGGHDPAVCGKGHGALMLWLLGYPDQAAREARDVVVFAESIGHVPSVGHALWWAAMVHQVRRDAPPVLDHSRRLLALCAEHALKQYQMIGSIMHGCAFAAVDNPAASFA